MKISRCSFDEVSFIPQNYDTEHADFAKRKKTEIWFKVADGDIICGCVCILLMSKDAARLSNIFILPEYRGRGLAQRLVKTVIAWSQANNFKTLDARSPKMFFLDHGFKQIERYKMGISWFKKDL